MINLEGKTFFITGGGTGIGQSFAQAAGAAGARMMIVGTTPSALEETAQLIGDDSRVEVIGLDVSDHDAVANAVAATVKRFGGLDCAFNNAAYYGPYSAIHEFPEAEFERVINTNVMGVMWCLKHQIAQMLPQGRGIIVNVGSASLGSIRQNSPAYVASKGAVVALTRAAALNYARAGLRINSFSPGATLTRMGRQLTDEQIQQLGDSIPIGRWGEADEMAAAALWMFCDDARYMIGSDFLVDGGFGLS